MKSTYMKQIVYLFLTLLLSSSLKAQVIKSFTQRSSSYSPTKLIYNIQGDFTMVGNTNLTLQSYSNNDNNSNNFMEYVDVDGDPNTFNSSSATLEFSSENGAIPECSNIIYAGLYWTGRASNSSSSPESFTVTKGGITKTLNKRQVSLKGPGQSGYTLLEANPGNIFYPNGTNGNMYSAYIEVTDYVKANGLGEYTVADMALLEGNGGATGYYGGWGMIVVYENSKMKWRDVTIFDGHAYVAGNSTINYELPVSGFNTAQSGPINMKLGVMAGEGDVGISGDYFGVRNWQDNAWIPLSHTDNSTSNFFNSSVSTGGNPRNPSLQNNTGLDIAMFDIPNSGNSVITNNQTSTRFRYGSTQDTYIIFCIAMAVDAYIPDVESIVSTETINGAPVGSGPLTILPGEDIEYKVQIKNQGTEAVNNAQFVVPIPYTASFVPGSILTQVNFTPLPTPNNAYYDPLLGPTGSVVWDFGTLPLPPVGFPDSVLAELTFHLEVTTDCYTLTNAACSPQVILNGGTTTGVGAISGSTFDMPFIQGYENSGTCAGEPINDPLVVDIDPVQYIADNCQNTPLNREFIFCNYVATSIPVDSITSSFPSGLSYYNTNNITPSSIQYDENNPFPATPGTQTYFAIPDGVNFCYYTFTITIQSPIITYAVQSDEVTCFGESNGAIDLTILNGIAPFSYEWTGPNAFTSTNQDISSLPDGSYNVIITDSIGCTAYDTTTVTIVVDNTDPIISCPSDINIDNDNGSCGAIVNYTTPIGIDNCPIGTHTSLTGGLSSGSFFSEGTTLVTYSVSDSIGNTATCSFNVTVNDVELPSIVCPTSINTVSDASTCVATGINLSTPVTNDNCGISSLSNNASSSFTVGSTNVTWTVTDIHNNINTCIQTVVVSDTVDPTIICPSPLNLEADAGSCFASGVTLGTPFTNDNCTVASVTNDAPATFPVGTTTVTWTVVDNAGNDATCTQSVTVTDDEDPTITCASDVTVNNTPGSCSIQSASVGLGNPTTNDNCGVASITNNAPASFPVGTTTVTWTVTDINGNTNNCNQLVTVTDNENPIITSCANSVTQPANPGVCVATGVNLGSPVATDNCGIASSLNDAPTVFPLGSTTVTWTITDVNGNVATCTQIVTITDNENPVISCPGTINVSADAGSCFASSVSLGTPTTSDNCGIASVTNDAPTTFPVGTTSVTWTVVDNAGNDATCTQSVVVTDDEDPTITCPTNVTVYNDLGNCSTSISNIGIGNPSTSDNCGVASVTNNAPTTFNVGTTTITWTVTDNSGNTSNCTQQVTVIDNQPPIITSCASTVTQTTNSTACLATGVNLGTPTATDNCGIATITNDAPASFPIGSTTVIWTVTDVNGNTANCDQVVVITDAEDPTISCPSTVNVNNTPDACYATGVNIGLPITNDNCTVLSITNDAPTNFPINTTVVTWTVTDASGNIATCAQNVIVVDNESPQINCAFDVTFSNDIGSCSTDSINVNLIEPSTYDNCVIDTVYNNAPSVFSVGTTNVTWTAIDIHGNSSFCTQTVTIEDNETPVITSCAAAITTTADPNLCGATNLSLGTPTATDNCGIATIVNDAPSLFPVGTTTVTWTITDVNGNDVTCTQEVVISDSETPSITCMPNSSVTADIGFCYATNVNLGTPTTSDNCGVASVTNNAPSIFPVGNTTVMWIVTDIHNNTDTCFQVITVEDNEAPVLTNCPSDTASCIPLVHYQVPTASDNCGIASISQVSGFGPGATFPVGITTEVWEITDINGNVSYCSFDVTIHSLPVPSITATNVSCFGLNDGELNVSIQNGTSPFEYLWNNGDSTQLIDSLSQGGYNVVVTDTFGCQGSTNAAITMPDSLIAAETISNVSCFGLSDASIDIEVSGGTTPYGYNWSNGANSQDLSLLPAGQYTITVTDINACEHQLTIDLTQPDTLIASGTIVDAICEGENGAIDLTILGGTSPYIYAWTNGDTSQDLDSVELGIYGVQVTDANGCTADYQGTIGSFSEMTLGRDIYHPLCYGDDGAIDLTIIDGTAPYTFAWSNGATTQNIEDVSAGTYTVTVTDANLCSESASFNVIQPDSLWLDYIVSEYTGGHGVSGFNQQDGEIDISIYGGVLPYDIQWLPTSSDEDQFNLAAGIYYVTVADFNGCTVSHEFVITQPLELDIPTGFTPNDDGHNDNFVINGVEAFPDNELTIYNRWGNIVYSKAGYNNEWNGLNNSGDKLPDGTYFVVFEIKSETLENNKVNNPYSGYVDLRRTR